MFREHKKVLGEELSFNVKKCRFNSLKKIDRLDVSPVNRIKSFLLRTSFLATQESTFYMQEFPQQ